MKYHCVQIGNLDSNFKGIRYYIRCCHIVAGMILLCDLKGSMRLYLREEVCAYFNLNHLRFQRTESSCGEVVALIKHAFF
jgi:hypothetical protein